MSCDPTTNSGQKEYDEYYKIQNERIKSNLESQDKMIISFSVAFFGLLPFILEKLFANKWLFYSLFFCNTFALMCVLASFWCCYKGNVKDLDFAREYYLENKEESFGKESKWTYIGKLMNFLSLISMLATFVIFAIILALNVNKGNKMSDQLEKNNTMLQEGVISAPKKQIQIREVADGAISAPMKPKSTSTQQDISKPVEKNK